MNLYLSKKEIETLLDILRWYMDAQHFYDDRDNTCNNLISSLEYALDNDD